MRKAVTQQNDRKGKDNNCILKLDCLRDVFVYPEMCQSVDIHGSTYFRLSKCEKWLAYHNACVVYLKI